MTKTTPYRRIPIAKYVNILFTVSFNLSFHPSEFGIAWVKYWLLFVLATCDCICENAFWFCFWCVVWIASSSLFSASSPMPKMPLGSRLPGVQDWLPVQTRCWGTRFYGRSPLRDSGEVTRRVLRADSMPFCSFYLCVSFFRPRGHRLVYKRLLTRMKITHNHQFVSIFIQE